MQSRPVHYFLCCEARVWGAGNGWPSPAAARLRGKARRFSTTESSTEQVHGEHGRTQSVPHTDLTPRDRQVSARDKSRAEHRSHR
ncbi:hypothetical protein AAFF_G00436920 [Aldrovandia affinis]|uniref:Uncharacterized protein n=1 Tax=Aldrovandia affinis TaxID=143900 RepID=A0AAD7WI56_9TELE|nr:hypothetical protein AAFF_G00436920 [Aldrovandia affinis]